MEDPVPANIMGEKRVVHSVEHHINWGYVAVGVAVIVLAVQFGPALVGSSGNAREEEPALIVEDAQTFG